MSVFLPIFLIFANPLRTPDDQKSQVLANYKASCPPCREAGP